MKAGPITGAAMPAVPDGHEALFPNAADRLRWDSHLTAALAASMQRVARGPVRAGADPDAFQAELAAFDFEDAVMLDDLFSWTLSRLETGLVHTGHPRYLGLFNPTPTFPAQCASRIAAAFNPQLASATTSPAAVAIEAHVIRAICARAGLGNAGTGHFTSGGSEANFTAVVTAATQAAPDFARSGARAFRGQPVFYISSDSHLAWVKIAHQAGIGRDAARMVKTDGIGRISIEALRAAIAADREAGRVPFMVAATAGTTNAGMVDPLEACAEVAREHGLWYHIDAAWGGALIASPKLRGLVAGLETADSVTIDAHKWFATTMGCGMFLTRHPGALTAAFSVDANFMPSQSATADPYMNSAQWSRQFLGLRLFLSLGAAGWAGHALHVERSVELARLLAEALRKHGWTLANWPALAVACLEPPAGSVSVREIVNRVVASGRAWVSVAMFEGREVLRACVTHGETSPADIAAVVEALEDCRHRAPGSHERVLENC